MAGNLTRISGVVQDLLENGAPSRPPGLPFGFDDKGARPLELANVTLGASAVAEVESVIWRIQHAQHFDEPLILEPGLAIPSLLARRIAEFWTDGVRGFTELGVLATWAGTRLEIGLERTLQSLPQTLDTAPFREIGLASERPDERVAIGIRIDRLLADRTLRLDYVEVLRTLWRTIEPVWSVRGQEAIRAACARWRAGLVAGTPILAMLDSDHPVVCLGLVPLLEAAIASSRVAISPCHFIRCGHIFDYSGTLCLDVRAQAHIVKNQYVDRGHTVARFTNSLGHPSRAAIVARLIDALATVLELAHAVALTRSAVGSHLRRLRAAGLVETGGQARPMRYRVSSDAVDRLLNEVSARLQGSHGRSSTIHADNISDGASFRTIFDDAPIAIIQLDLEGRCLSCNSAAQRMFGYEESDMVQLRTTHLLADSRDEDVFELFERMIRTPRRREVRLRRRDGGLFWSSVTVSVVSDDTGQPCFAYVMAEDLSERRGAEDLVTGLPNRALFFSQLAHSLRAGRRDERGMALLMLDLDRFKNVNDTLGHAAGDDLLKQLSARLITTLRASDTIARIGGDEFAVLLIGTSDRRALIDVARKIRDALKPPFVLGMDVVTVGASIGIARCPRSGGTVETLMRQADAAMYLAKRTGSGYHIHREMRMKTQV